MPKKYHVAIVGATGAVGIELLRVMERRNFPVADLRLLASPRSTGKTLAFRGQEISRRSARTRNSFAGIDLAFFSAGAGTSQDNSLQSRSGAGAIVIDNSSAFRMDEVVPLIIPEINPEDVRDASGNHRESELHHGRRVDGVVSVASRLRVAPRFRCKLSGRLRQRRAGDRRVATTSRSRRARRRGHRAGLSASDRFQRRCRMSIPSSRTATPRKK